MGKKLAFTVSLFVVLFFLLASVTEGRNVDAKGKGLKKKRFWFHRDRHCPYNDDCVNDSWCKCFTYNANNDAWVYAGYGLRCLQVQGSTKRCV